MKGLFKSYILKIKLFFLPIISFLVKFLSVVNGLLSVAVITLLIYELGFQMDVDQKILRPLYTLTFITFFSDFILYILLHIMDKKRPKGWNWQLTLFIILCIIVIIWVVPQKYVEGITPFLLLRHFRALELKIGRAHV